MCSQSTTGLPANCIATVVALVIGGLGAGPGEGERGSQLNAPISTQPVLSEADRLRIQAEERLRYETRQQLLRHNGRWIWNLLGGIVLLLVSAFCTNSKPTSSAVGVPKSIPFVPRFHSSLSAPRSRCAIHNFEKIAISLQSIKLPHPLAPDRVPLKRNSSTKEPFQIYVDSSAGCRESGQCPTLHRSKDGRGQGRFLSQPFKSRSHLSRRHVHPVALGGRPRI